MQPQPEKDRRAGVYFGGWNNFRGQFLEVVHARKARDAHEGQKPRDNKKKKIVSSIDG